MKSLKHSYRFLLTLFFLSFLWAYAFSYDSEIPSPKHPIAIYSSHEGHNLRAVLQKAIQSAEHSIFYAIFNLTDPELLQTLKQADRKGISVEILTDPKQEKNLRKQIANSDIKVLHIPDFQGLMHQKILIIDKQLVFLGSCNATRHSFEIHENQILAIRSSKLAQNILKKHYERIANPKQKIPSTNVDSHIYNIRNQTLEFYSSPWESYQREKIINHIDQAEKSLYIAMFTWTNSRLCDAVCRAQERGVEILVAIDRNSSHGASSLCLQKLLEHGVRVRWQKGPGLLHYKCAWIDEKILITGSSNWTNSAFFRNWDHVAILYPLQYEQNKQLQKMWRAIYLQSEETSIAPWRNKVQADSGSHPITVEAA